MEKFEFPFNNIIGGNAEQKNKIKENYKKKNKKFFKKDKFKYFWLEKSLAEEEKKDIERIKEYVSKISQSYGAPKKPSPKIIVLKPGGVYKATKGRFKEGGCSSFARQIIIDSSTSKVNFATCLAHEMFHLDGYTSLRFSQEAEDVEFHRAGISIFGKDGETVYFTDIEEALIAEAVQIFYDQYLRKDPQFNDEIKKTDFVKEWLKKFYDWAKVTPEEQKEFLDNIYSFPDIDGLVEKLSGKDNDEFKFGFLHGYIKEMLENGDVIMRERLEERKKFDSLVNMILKYSKNEYKNRQEIVDVFMQANFSGRLLSLARMVEKTLGRGSFRSIGKDSAGVR